MASREEIVEQVMALPPADRAFVADAIDQSLGTGGLATPEVAAAWAAEIERRIAAYERGEMVAVDMDISLERMRRHLEEHRSRKVKT